MVKFLHEGAGLEVPFACQIL